MRPLTLSLLTAAALLGGLQTGYTQTGTIGSSSTASAKSNLSSGEKKFIKDAAESHLAVMRLTELTKGGAGAPTTKELSTKINDDLTKSWGELATMAETAKVELPESEPSSSDKNAIEKLKKLEADKFDKAYLKALGKETSRGAKLFADAGKSVKSEELKTFITTHAAAVKAHDDAVTAAEKELGKKK